MTVTSVVRPLPGPGLVARSGDLILVCAEGTEATRGEVEQLLGLVPEVAATGGDGAVLVRRVAALLAADLDGNFPDCAASGPIADGRFAVLVYGTATARVVGGEGEVSLSATDAVAPVTRLVHAPITTVRLELPGAGPASHFARLEGGVVSAAGFVAGEEAPGGAATVLPVPVPAQPVPEPVQVTVEKVDTPSWTIPSPSVPAPVEAPAWAGPSPSVAVPPVETPSWAPPAEIPVPVPAPSDNGGFSTVVEPQYPEPQYGLVPEPAAPVETAPSWAGPSIADGAFVPAPSSTVDPPTPALPVREPLATEAMGLDVRPTVLGLACPLGHLNDPSLAVCTTCGASLASQPPALREGPRPPLGAITLDDGSSYLLDIGYVLGREPQHDPEVVSGGARPLKIVDAEGVVSRRHLRVALVGWDIQIVDLGSANGTYVQYPDDPQLHRLEPHHAVVVKAGAQVTMGRRSFRIDSAPLA